MSSAFARMQVDAPFALDLSRASTEVRGRIGSEISAFAPSGKRWFLGGYPTHGNIGDQLLWTAQRRMARANDWPVDGLILNKGSQIHPCPGRRQQISDGVLVFPGGGSLGNRYSSSAWRVALMQRYPEATVIQLPQSTTFARLEEDPLLQLVRQWYGRPGRVLVMCRDRTSAVEARDHLGLDPVLCRDLVSELPDLSYLQAGGMGGLLLVRSDDETAAPGHPILSESIMDWTDLRLPLRDRLLSPAFALTNRLRAAGDSFARRRIGLIIADRRAALLSMLAVALFSVHDYVVTDRLHGMILAAKLGLPCHVVDNDHGKISRYYDTWRDDFPLVTWHDDLGSALWASR